MNRRQFLASSSVLAVGCRGRNTPDPVAVAKAKRAEQLAKLQNYRVPKNATRTTPKHKIDVLALLPDLKPLVRVAVRLHPRYSEEPQPHESKLGGQFLWPAHEDWPLCPSLRLPMQPLLQLTAADASPQFPFRPQTDLFQLLWSPKRTSSNRQFHGVWRKSSDVGPDLAAPPEMLATECTPVPCRFFPERLPELPPFQMLPGIMKATIALIPEIHDNIPELFTPTRGFKVGGWTGDTSPKLCHTCKNHTDYLLTIDQCEWQRTSLRWKPPEDPDEDGFRRAAHIHEPGDDETMMNVHICRRCEKWPLRF